MLAFRFYTLLILTCLFQNLFCQTPNGQPENNSKNTQSSRLQKSQSFDYLLGKTSKTPSKASEYYGPRLILSDKDWFKYVMDYADKNLESFKEKEVQQFLFSYNNASVKALRSRAILYRTKNGHYRLLMSIPLVHYKTLDDELSVDPFPFQLLKDEFDRISCDKTFISFLWISYGNFDYINDLDPALKRANTFLVTSDVFTNEGRVELHSEFLDINLLEPIKKAFREVDPGLLDKLKTDNVAEKNKGGNPRGAQPILNYKYHFNYPEFDFVKDPIKPLVQARVRRTESFIIVPPILYNRRMYLDWRNRERHAPYVFDDGGSSSINFGSKAFSYLDHKGSVQRYQVKTFPVGTIEKSQKFETPQTTLDIFKFIKVFEIYKPSNIVDLARAIYVTAKVPGFNSNYLCTSEFKFIVNPCEIGVMPDIDQKNTNKLREVVFKDHADFLPWIIVGGQASIRSGSLKYADNYSLDFKPDAKQFDHFVDGLDNIREIYNTQQPIPFFGPYTYRYLTNAIVKWPRANIADLSQLRYISNKSISKVDIGSRNPNSLAGARQSSDEGLNIITTISEKDKEKISNLRLEIYDHNTGEMQLAVTSRTENFFVSQLPHLKDMPSVGNIKIYTNDASTSEESKEISYSIFENEQLRNSKGLSTAYPTFGVELTNCSKENLEYLFISNEPDRSEIDLYGRASELIRLRSNSAIGGSVSICYTETNSTDLLGFIKEYLGASEAQDYEDYLKIFYFDSNGEWHELETYIDKMNNVATSQLPTNEGNLTLAVFPSAVPNVQISIPTADWSVYPKPNVLMPFYDYIFMSCISRHESNGNQQDFLSNQRNSEKFISVAPNRVNAERSVVLEKYCEDDVSVEFYNALGILIEQYQLKEPKKQINLQLFPSGIYHIRAHRNGNSQTIKLIVE